MHEQMRRDPVAIRVAILRRQLLGIGGGELPDGARRDQHLHGGGEPEHIRDHAAGAIFVEQLDAVHLAVAARERDLDAVLRFESRGERPHDLIDDEISVVGDLAFLLGLGDQLGADLGSRRGGGVDESAQKRGDKANCLIIALCLHLSVVVLAKELVRLSSTVLSTELSAVVPAKAGTHNP